MLCLCCSILFLCMFQVVYAKSCLIRTHSYFEILIFFIAAFDLVEYHHQNEYSWFYYFFPYCFPLLNYHWHFHRYRYLFDIVQYFDDHLLPWDSFLCWIINGFSWRYVSNFCEWLLIVHLVILINFSVRLFWLWLLFIIFVLVGKF